MKNAEESNSVVIRLDFAIYRSIVSSDLNVQNTHYLSMQYGYLGPVGP